MGYPSIWQKGEKKAWPQHQIYAKFSLSLKYKVLKYYKKQNVLKIGRKKKNISNLLPIYIYNKKDKY